MSAKNRPIIMYADMQHIIHLQQVSLSLFLLVIVLPQIQNTPVCRDHAFDNHGVFGIWRRTKTRRKSRKAVSVLYIFLANHTCIHNYVPILSRYSELLSI